MKDYGKNTRITLETAKLLKEKGFDIMVNGYYVEYKINQIDPEYPEGGGPFGMTKGEVEYDESFMVNGERDYGDFSCKSYDCYSAPTQGIVHRWLREVHKFHVKVEDWEGEKWFYEIKDFDRRYSALELKKVGGDEKWEFDTYEEALEMGLQQALKLL